MSHDDDGMVEPEWSIRFEDLTFHQLVGRGNFGKVWKGEYFGTDVAIKLLLRTDDKEETEKYIQREVTVLTGIRHPNVVNFMGVARNEVDGVEDFYVVTEWLPKGDLHRLVNNKEIKLSWKRRVRLALHCSVAMEFLHRKNIIHRDLKSANLLIATDGSLKIADFGLARKKRQEKSMMTYAGTDEWMAPEIILGEDYDEKCDVFSFGVVLFELITRSEPLKRSPATCFEFDDKKWQAAMPPDCPPKLSALATRCVDYFPHNRPSFHEVSQELKAMLNDGSLPDEGEHADSEIPVREIRDPATEEKRRQAILLKEKLLQELEQPVAFSPRDNNNDDDDNNNNNNNEEKAKGKETTRTDRNDANKKNDDENKDNNKNNNETAATTNNGTTAEGNGAEGDAAGTKATKAKPKKKKPKKLRASASSVATATSDPAPLKSPRATSTELARASSAGDQSPSPGGGTEISGQADLRSSGDPKEKKRKKDRRKKSRDPARDQRKKEKAKEKELVKKAMEMKKQDKLFKRK